jgi:hypothetical protein
MARKTRRRTTRKSRRRRKRGGAAVVTPDHYNGVVRMFRSLQSRGMNTISEGGVIHHYASNFVDPMNAPGYPAIIGILNRLVDENILTVTQIQGENEYTINPDRLIPV